MGIKRYSQTEDRDYPVQQDDDGDLVRYSDHLATVEALNKRIEELEAERRWIPVAERLPEEENLYLRFDGFFVSTGWWNNHGKWDDEDQADYDLVTHWQPLPKAPQ